MIRRLMNSLIMSLYHIKAYSSPIINRDFKVLFKALKEEQKAREKFIASLIKFDKIEKRINKTDPSKVSKKDFDFWRNYTLDALEDIGDKK